MFHISQNSVQAHFKNENYTGVSCPTSGMSRVAHMNESCRTHTQTRRTRSVPPPWASRESAQRAASTIATARSFSFPLMNRTSRHSEAHTLEHGPCGIRRRIHTNIHSRTRRRVHTQNHTHSHIHANTHTQHNDLAVHTTIPSTAWSPSVKTPAILKSRFEMPEFGDSERLFAQWAHS